MTTEACSCDKPFLTAANMVRINFTVFWVEVKLRLLLISLKNLTDGSSCTE